MLTDESLLINFRGMLRKLGAMHVWTIRRTDFDRFHSEQYRVRRDFDRIS